VRQSKDSHKLLYSQNNVVQDKGWNLNKANHRKRIILLALLLDLALGDPPNRYHPVAWMGNIIYKAQKNAPQNNRFLFGGCVAIGGSFFIWILLRLILRLSEKMPTPLNWILEAILLKMTFSLGGLDQAAQQVETALNANDLNEAKRWLSWHLVSRDVTNLNESQVTAAAIESVAENTSDGIVAPLLFYSIGGLPAAAAYRYVNTTDSILGCRDAEREWLGKIPARFDDLLNIIPSRVTALLFITASNHNAWNIWQRDSDKTASPNAGHPMSAMAGALMVELEKVDHYILGAGGEEPQAGDIRKSRRLMYLAVGILVTLITFLPTRTHHAN